MRTSSVHRRLVLTTSVLALATAAPSVSPAAVFMWNGGTDLFTNPAAWGPLGVPGASDDAQVYAANSVVEIFGTTQNVGTMELGAAANSGNKLNLNDGFLYVNQNAFTNNGVITLANASRLDSGWRHGYDHARQQPELRPARHAGGRNLRRGPDDPGLGPDRRQQHHR